METIWGSLPKRQGTTARPVSTLSSRESIPVLDHPVVFSCYTSIASSPRHWTLLYDLRKAATERKDDRSVKYGFAQNAAHRLPSLIVGAQSREPRRTRTSELKKKVHHPCRRICLLCWHCVCVGIVRMVNDYPDTCFSQICTFTKPFSLCIWAHIEFFYI